MPPQKYAGPMQTGDDPCAECGHTRHEHLKWDWSDKKEQFEGTQNRACRKGKCKCETFADKKKAAS